MIFTFLIIVFRRREIIKNSLEDEYIDLYEPHGAP